MSFPAELRGRCQRSRFPAWIYGLTLTPEETAQITYIAMKRIRGCVR